MAGKSKPSRVIEEFGQGRLNLHQIPLHLGGIARNLGYRQIGFVLQKLLSRPPPASVLGVFLDLHSVWSGVSLECPHKRRSLSAGLGITVQAKSSASTSANWGAPPRLQLAQGGRVKPVLFGLAATAATL